MTVATYKKKLISYVFSVICEALHTVFNKDYGLSAEKLSNEGDKAYGYAGDRSMN